MKKVTTIINLKQVEISAKRMRLEEVRFCSRMGDIARGYTEVELQYDEPNVYPKGESHKIFVAKNYFLGDLRISWSPRQSFGKGKNLDDQTLGMTESEKQAFEDNLKRRKKEVDVFTLIVPEDCGHKDLFERAVKNADVIGSYMNLLNNRDDGSYSAGDQYSDCEKQKTISEKADALWNQLDERGVVIAGKLIEPRFVYILPIYRPCPKARCQAYKYGRWLTPNVFETDKEAKFVDMMKSFYYAHLV